MKTKTVNRITSGIICGMIGISSFALVKTIAEARKAEDVLNETIYVVHTDAESHPYAVITDLRLMERVLPEIALTVSLRDDLARIVAGQADGKSVTCQTMVANVIYNQMMTTGGKIDGTDFAACPRKAPTDDTYKAVDAIFVRGEWLLDDTVMWTGDAENPDAFHQSLRLVTSQEGVAFYEVNT